MEVNGCQAAGIIILAVYYGAYFTKIFVQKRKGIVTTQLGRGNKGKRTVITERTLQVLSVLTVIAEIFCVVYDRGETFPKAVRILGLVLAAAGAFLFMTAMCAMRESWRAGIPEGKDTELVTEGIYKMSRNPAFLGFDLVYIGMGTAFFHIGLCIVSMMGMIMMHLQILEEEKFLRETFGEEYAAYQKRVGRYFSIRAKEKRK